MICGVARVYARQRAQHAVIQVLEVMQPLAQVRIARGVELGAVFAAHALHRSIGGEPCADAVLELEIPAGI